MYFHLHKATCQARPLANSLGRQNVSLAHLIAGSAEIFDLNCAFVDQSFNAVIYAAKADTKFPHDAALRQVRVLLRDAHHAGAHHGSVAEHVIIGWVPGYRIRGHWRDLLKRRKFIIATMTEKSQQATWHSMVKSTLRVKPMRDLCICDYPVAALA